MISLSTASNPALPWGSDLSASHCGERSGGASRDDERRLLPVLISARIEAMSWKTFTLNRWTAGLAFVLRGFAVTDSG